MGFCSGALRKGEWRGARAWLVWGGGERALGKGPPERWRLLSQGRAVLAG